MNPAQMYAWMPGLMRRLLILVATAPAWLSLLWVVGVTYDGEHGARVPQMIGHQIYGCYDPDTGAQLTCPSPPPTASPGT